MTHLVRQPRMWLLAAAAAVAAALLATMLGGGVSTAAAADPVTDDSVTVSGVGSVPGQPDMMTAHFRTHAKRSTASAALSANATVARKVISALEKAGVDEDDITTSDLSLYRRHDRKTGTTSFVANEAITGVIRSISSAGAAIDAVVASASNVDVDGMDLGISDPSALADQARSAAFADAKARAQQYATLSGRSLGRVERIDESTPSDDGDCCAYGAAADRAAAAPTPVLPGQQAVTVQVTVIWQLV